MAKRTPEERERLERLIESGREARANMQAIIERQQAHVAADEAKRERRRAALSRLLPFRRAA
jgi:hypothetical protein